MPLPKKPTADSDCSLLQQLYNNGYEVASHTLTHQRMNEYSREQVVAEVAGGRAMLAATCGIPDGDIVGFRAPFLQSRPTLRQVLHGAGGFLYDSSLLEEAEGSIARGLAARVWPYSMDGGIPQDCSRWSPAQECNQRERYPGLFQVPVWVAQDWAKDSRGAYKILKSSFDAAYEGNRAPLPIFIHTSWFEDHLDGMLQFIDYVQSKPHAYFVTMRQLLAWMQRPVPAGQLTPAALAQGAGDSRGPVSTASTPSASWEPATGSAEASPAASSSAINVVAVAGGVAGGVVATLLLTTTACFMVKRRQERDRSAAAGGAGLPQGPHQGGVTAHISGSAAAGMGVKTRAARLAEEDSAYSSSPRFMLTPRTRIGDMA
ncbi:hypothetical protein CHLNCDRAFT_136061 [Chlorella variabilis]|uniref:NodB homology domain-containing protein n=1 Tax=Chlorella variabilis TaxID=554065 RepID=E1ZJN6_CHLVA|nr:hypothetical protein CHLNCDRAFT_136061 [Chlorella variabilis]EFN54021.1 hypothetical protein CHLNCDRAFT_136061 [Chlorella variabilis]|eukprot:XP_005846123.1 hypothetical protein CHLNCDRAFT_136061 [Chlorella variabilis]